MEFLRQFKHWPAVLFFALSLFIFFFLSNHSYNPIEKKFEYQPPTTFSGDEPHYLIIISNILFNHDLSVGDNYRSVYLGGIDAGQNFRGQNLDHHVLIQNVRTNESIFWNKIFNYTKPIECVTTDPSCIGFARISNLLADYTPINKQYRERPIHPLPFPSLLALLSKAIGTTKVQTEADAFYIVVFLSWLTGIITYICALKIGFEIKESLGAVALLFYASPWLTYSHELFPATFLGLLLAVTLWAFISKRFVTSAILLGIACMQSEAFILIFPAWILFLCFHRELKNAFVFASTGVGALAVIILINYFIFDKILLHHDIFVFDPILMWRTILSPKVGAWFFAPWTIPVIYFLIRSFFSYEKKVSGTTYVMNLVATGIFPVAGVLMIMPLGGYCYGPRYWVPFLPWLAIVFLLGAESYWKIPKSLNWSIFYWLLALSIIISFSAAILPSYMIWGAPPWRALEMIL